MEFRAPSNLQIWHFRQQLTGNLGNSDFAINLQLPNRKMMSTGCGYLRFCDFLGYERQSEPLTISLLTFRGTPRLFQWHRWDSRMRKSLIVAMAEDRVIGRGNALPWHIPEDLAKFKELTLNKPIIMGRRTFESIGRPLPQRTNIVVTRDYSFHHPNVYSARCLEEAIEIARRELPVHNVADEEIMIIGGEQIFDMALSDQEVDTIYMTHVQMKVADGDAYFPELDSAWHAVEKSTLVAPVDGRVGATFEVLQRTAA